MEVLEVIYGAVRSGIVSFRDSRVAAARRA